MSGIDQADQMVLYYDCLRKTTRWYKKLALHIFDIFVFNSCCLSLIYGTVKTISLLKFREIVVINLNGDKLTNQVIPCSNNDLHYLAPIPSKEKKKLPTKPCQNCPQEKCKETRYKCITCDCKPALCIGECFKVYHDSI